MKIAIISDIHSNITALEAVIQDIKSQGCDTVHCLGDILGYGPHPLECLQMVLQFKGVVLQGNHEDCVVNPELSLELNRFAREGVDFSRSKLNKEIIDSIGKLPFIKEFDKTELNLVLCHGSFTEPQQWNYIDSPFKTKEQLKVTSRQICMIGHTHTPFVFDSKTGLHKFIPDNLELKENYKYMINVGSVGQPRDGDCRSSYGILNIEGGITKFDLRRVFYDISKEDKAIRAANISPELAERLYLGD